MTPTDHPIGLDLDAPGSDVAAYLEAAEQQVLADEVRRLRADLAIANRGGLDLLYAIRKAIGWTDKHDLSLLPGECARLYRASVAQARKAAPLWPGRGYDHSQPGGFDGPTGAD